MPRKEKSQRPKRSIKISLRSGKTPTPTSQSSEKPKPSTRSCKHKFAPTVRLHQRNVRAEQLRFPCTRSAFFLWVGDDASVPPSSRGQSLDNSASPLNGDSLALFTARFSVRCPRMISATVLTLETS